MHVHHERMQSQHWSSDAKIADSSSTYPNASLSPLVLLIILSRFLVPADPLRVLRAIRFATRFNFILEDTLLDAAGSDKVRACFLT